MILAAADYGLQKAGTTPPDPLLSGFNCERWGTEAVFGPGPLPGWLLTQMNVCLSTYRAHQADRQNQLPLDKWAERYPHYWNVVSQTKLLRVQLKSQSCGTASDQ